MKYRDSAALRATISLISVLLVVGVLIPAVTHASVLSVLLASIKGNVAEASAGPQGNNVQTMALLRPAMNWDPAPRGGGDITIIDDSALMPEEGPAGTIADIEKPKNATISVYIVREGDTLSQIAEMFEVSPNTILWANDLPRNAKITVGQKLTILPVTGVRYAVKSGDTLASIAKKFGADSSEIASYNGLDGTSLATGATIIIPNGEITAPAPQPASRASVRASVTVAGSSVKSGYFSAPLSHYIKSQGIHGYNGVDLAAPVGTPIMAAASGEVIIAKEGGYNGGYGSYVVIQHGNGSQTLYAHQSNVVSYVGQTVGQGEVIGYVGNSGRSTGAHLHFEIRNGGRNPF